jgi:hypothetical protein
MAAVEQPVKDMAEVMFLEYQDRMAQDYPYTGRGKAFTWNSLPELSKQRWIAVAKKVISEFDLYGSLGL